MKMKFFLVICFVCICFSLDSQNFKQNIAISFSNNGQLESVLDEFYFSSQGGYQPANDVFSYKQTEYKFNLSYECNYKDLLSLGLNFGYGSRKDKYRISNQYPTHIPVGEKKQYYYNYSLSVSKIWSTGRIQLQSGIEIPIYVVGKYSETYMIDDSTQKLMFVTATPGGICFGINNVTKLKFFLSKRIYLSSIMNFGALNYHLGGDTSLEIINQNPVIYFGPFDPIENTYNKFSISKPEFHFGIGFSFY